MDVAYGLSTDAKFTGKRSLAISSFSGKDGFGLFLVQFRAPSTRAALMCVMANSIGLIVYGQLPRQVSLRDTSQMTPAARMRRFMPI